MRSSKKRVDMTANTGVMCVYGEGDKSRSITHVNVGLFSLVPGWVATVQTAFDAITAAPARGDH